MKQFDVWWAELPAPVGRRPVLILTRTAAVQYLSKLVVAEITSIVRSIPQEVPVGRAEGLARACVVNLDNVHVVPVRGLVARAGALGPARHAEVKRALGHALAWPELMGA
jgi:mRNA interferase MazF